MEVESMAQHLEVHYCVNHKDTLGELIVSLIGFHHIE